jgi:hypothetical protein
MQEDITTYTNALFVMCRKKIMTGVFRYGKTKTRKPRVDFMRE